MVYGLWFMVYGLWFMVYGLWFMVYSLWFMVSLVTCSDGGPDAAALLPLVFEDRDRLADMLNKLARGLAPWRLPGAVERACVGAMCTR